MVNVYFYISIALLSIDCFIVQLLVRGFVKRNIGPNLHFNLSSSLANSIHPRNQNNEGNVDRLAVMLVYSTEDESKEIKNLKYLKCALQQLYANVGQHTPLDAFVWVAPERLLSYRSQLESMFPTVYVMALDEESWTLPNSIGHHSEWVFSDIHSPSYYKMGLWRLTFSLAFIRARGYQYMLQMDDDTFILDNIDFNIVSYFRRKGVSMGVRRKVQVDLPAVVLGLAELTRFWMVTRNVTEPTGVLFDHLAPPSMEGLTSAGWDRHFHIGAFMIFDVDFWFQDTVQDYLSLVLATRAATQMRWQDQVGLHEFLVPLLLSLRAILLAVAALFAVIT